MHLVKSGVITGSTWPTQCGLEVPKGQASVFQSRTTCQNCLDACSVLLPGQARSPKKLTATKKAVFTGRKSAPVEPVYEWE